MKLVYGIGINDVKNSSKSKAYKYWSGILFRCYSKQPNKKLLTYKNAFIDIRWQKLSNFISWFDNNYIEGYDLDKDIFIPNNKIYSPELCLFVPHSLNNITTNKKIAGKYLTGVNKNGNKYQAKIRINGNRLLLGSYNTEQDAYQAYINKKAEVYMNEADNWIDINYKLAIGLYRHASQLLYNDWSDIPCYK